MTDKERKELHEAWSEFISIVGEALYLPKVLDYLIRFFPPAPTADMKRDNRLWRWDRVKGWITICARCKAHHCQCGGFHDHT